jgi:hypothetical protein
MRSKAACDLGCALQARPGCELSSGIRLLLLLGWLLWRAAWIESGIVLLLQL